MCSPLLDPPHPAPSGPDRPRLDHQPTSPVDVRLAAHEQGIHRLRRCKRQDEMKPPSGQTRPCQVRHLEIPTEAANAPACKTDKELNPYLQKEVSGWQHRLPAHSQNKRSIKTTQAAAQSAVACKMILMHCLENTSYRNTSQPLRIFAGTEASLASP